MTEHEKRPETEDEEADSRYGGGKRGTPGRLRPMPGKPENPGRPEDTPGRRPDDEGEVEPSYGGGRR